MKLKRQPPTRKQRFEAALKLAGMSWESWCEANGVTQQHIRLGFRGERVMSAEFNATIDAFIADHLTNAA